MINNISYHNIEFIKGVEDPFVGLLLSNILQKNNIFFISKSDQQMEVICNFINNLNIGINIFKIPAWDTIPYDISSPNREITSERIQSISKIINFNYFKSKNLIITTFNALSIKNAPIEFFKKRYFKLKINSLTKITDLQNILNIYGYRRVEIVRELGEYSVRGDIVDIFSNNFKDPIRIYFLDDKVERINLFDPLSQRNIKDSIGNTFTFFSVREYEYNNKLKDIFKYKYISNFELDIKNDFFYNSVMSDQEFEGTENYLYLFHKNDLSNIFEVIESNLSLKENLITISYTDILSELKKRDEEIDVNYNDRKNENDIKILKKKRIYLNFYEINAHLKFYNNIIIDNFSSESSNVVDFNCKKIIEKFNLNYNKETESSRLDKFIISELKKNNTIIFCMNDYVKINNLINHLKPFFLEQKIFYSLISPNDLLKIKNKKSVLFCNILIDYSFSFNSLVFISEFIFFQKEKLKIKKRRNADSYLKDLNTINKGDYVAHIDHGIGKYDKLEIVNVSGSNHDCLKILYHNGDKLYIPVENINLLSKVADASENKILDRLGSTNWIIKKNNVKNKIKELAQSLINTAANRNIHVFDKIQQPENYNKFVDDFPYVLTDDQESSINDVLNDIYSQKLMDRLICGDVGFGKTEIALRTAFIIASSGKQVALVTPTTILCEQHFKTFKDRFKQFNYEIRSLSRMNSLKEKDEIKTGLKKGIISIVIGTHALMSKDISFNDLGLIIIDEEQHFGVSQKERLKELQYNVHVLTLTATPIPRTLQLSLTGLKELSLIATPPVNRLSVRTFVQKWDIITVKDALNREIKRRGQVFVVCPRIRDIDDMHKVIKNLVPSAKFSIAHGRLNVEKLENEIKKFYDNKSNILISTNIIESGIDIPNANTLIVHNSDLFGLSQLYQLRGRVGRSSARAYAYFTYNNKKVLSDKSRERLKVLKTLDQLGAGFTLANYDLDLRGAGNLLGDEQSGQIREIGYELYQKFLKDAILSIKKGKVNLETWSPTINLSLPVLIPDEYVNDLATRMSLYRKIGELKNKNEIQEFLGELVERFGAIPNEVKNLIFTIRLKIRCIELNIDYIDVGPKAILIGFKNNVFKNINSLVNWISQKSDHVRLRNDQKLIISYNMITKNKFNLLVEYLEEFKKLA